MLRVGFQRQYGATAAFRMQRKRVRLAAAADTAAEPDIVPDMPEMVDVMDDTLEDVNSAVYSVLKQYTPHTMMPFTRTFITIGIVCSLIVAVSQALAYAARYAAQKLTRDENDDDEVTTFSTTASLLKPLFVTLPIIGWLVALQRGFTGLDTLFHVCTKQPAWFKNTLASNLHSFVDWAAPLRCHLANATAVVMLISLTWTLMILKRRVFNRIVTRMTIDSHGTKEDAAAADMSRSLLPLNTLLSWFLVGTSSLLGLKVIGLDPSPLLAVGGVSGIVVGFASQQLLLNLIAGISIFLTRPFIVGDVVQLKNNHLLIGQGTITNISPLRTTFLDDNSQAVTLPNKLITDLIITNYGRVSQERSTSRSMAQNVKQILTHEITLQKPDNCGLSYDDYARVVADGLRERLAKLPHTIPDSMKVFVSGLSSSGDIQITVVGVGLRKAHMPAETTRQEFFLCIHNALDALRKQQIGGVQHEVEEQDAEAKALAEAEMVQATMNNAMSSKASGPKL